MSSPYPVTAKGTVIQPYHKTGVGKLIGSYLYLHVTYLWGLPEDLFPKRFVTAAVRKYMILYPSYWQTGQPNFSCVRLDLKTRDIRFDEAPDFDTSREPTVGRWVRVLADGSTSTGHSHAIWHHKWLWVRPTYKGFNVQEAIDWSAKYSPLLTSPPSGSAKKFKEQLKAVGLE